MYSSFIAQIVPWDKKVTHKAERSILHSGRDEGWFFVENKVESGETPRGRSILYFGRGEGDPLQSARANSVQEEHGVADFSWADHDAIEEMEDF